MDGDKSNNWGYQPASTPMPQQNDEFSFMNIVDDESTGVLNNARSVGSTNQVFFPPNLTPTTPFPRRPMHGAYHPNPYAPSGTNNNLIVDLNQHPNYMNISSNVPNFYPQHHHHLSHHFSSFQNPGFERSSSLASENAHEIIDLTQEDDDSDFCSTRAPHVSNTREPGVGNPAILHPQHIGGTRSLNQDQLHSIPFGDLRGLDGNFPSLGNEYTSNVVPKFDFSNRAMGGDQIRSVSPSLSMLHPQAKNHVDTGPNRGGFSGFQNIGGLPSSQYGMSMKNYAGGLSTYTSNDASVSSSHDVQTLQTNRQHSFPNSPNNNLGFIPNPDTRYANTNQYASLRAWPTESAGPPGNTSTGFHHPAQTELSSVAPSSVDLSRTTALANLDRYQKLFQQSERNKFLGNTSSNRYGGSTSRVYPGQVIPTSRHSVAQAGCQSPQLLMRSNQQACQVIPTSRNSVAQAGNESTQLLIRSNQQAGRPISSSENYTHLQGSNMHAIPPMKRGLIHPDPSLARAQRRRMTLPHPSSPHVSSWPQTAPPGFVHISASRGGSSRDPKPSGYNCKLCKRDLAFPPEGPIHNPRVPPGVAVLPCQHTFHDECLQRTMPDDQATNPSCIPCALGEK